MAAAVLTFARAEKVDMIITGSRGRNDAASILQGSTSHMLTHNAECAPAAPRRVPRRPPLPAAAGPPRYYERPPRSSPIN